MGHEAIGRNEALDAQMAEVRELLAEVRGVTKDLNEAIKRGNNMIVDVAIPSIQAHLDTVTRQMYATLNKTMDAAQRTIVRELADYMDRSHADDPRLKRDRYNEVLAIVSNGRKR